MPGSKLRGVVRAHVKSYTRRAKSKFKPGSIKRKPKRRRPRYAIRSSPFASANVHMFKRSYDHPFSIGRADSDNGVLLNTDSRYMIVQLHTKFNKLPEYDEFKALFSEYKITSINHKLVPYYANNIAQSNVVDAGSSSAYGVSIPNYEVFALPVNSSAREASLELKNGVAIDSYINQSQRKGRRIMPSRTQTYKTLHPKVVGYKGPLSKDAGTALMRMESPSYLNTDSTALVSGGVDQTDVTHYGVTLLIRRVDGLPINDHGHGNSAIQHMGFRMENEVFFKCRKVQ